jgi:hypothetical protein
MLKLYLLFNLLYLSACSTSYDPKPFIPETVSDNTSIVYIYRPKAMSNAIYSPGLFVNNEYKLSIKNGQHSSMTFAPGKTKFEIQPDNNYSGSRQLSLTLIAGNSYYIRVDTSLKIKNSTSYEPYQRSFNLVVVDGKLAVDQIAECCLVKKTASEKQNSPAEIEHDDGFSVDKTHNPFSH